MPNQWGNFAVGPYAATYTKPGGSPLDLGLVEGVRRWQRVAHARDVKADLYGESTIDGVYRGGDTFCLMTFKFWTQAVKNALWPFSDTFGALGTIGRMLTDLAGTLILTAVAGTPAATGSPTGPNVLTFGKAILSPGHNSEIILGAEERNIPVVFRCYPYDNSGAIVWFTEA